MTYNELKRNLWELRKDVSLCSLYYSDYENSFDIDPHIVADFFDSYADFIGELMEEEHGANYDFYKLLKGYDTPENLVEWFGCYDCPPFDFEEVEEELAA